MFARKQPSHEESCYRELMEYSNGCGVSGWWCGHRVMSGGPTREKLGILPSTIKKSRINCNEIYEYCHTEITIFQLFSVNLLCLCLEFVKQI